MTSADRGGRRGIAVIATAEDHEQAAEWQQALTAAGVMSVLHGHRTDEAEDGAEYTGVDVLVPASAMRQAREILGSEVVAPESEERPFPWLLLALGPAIFFVIVLVLVVLLA